MTHITSRTLVYNRLYYETYIITNIYVVEVFISFSVSLSHSIHVIDATFVNVTLHRVGLKIIIHNIVAFCVLTPLIGSRNAYVNVAPDVTTRCHHHCLTPAKLPRNLCKQHAKLLYAKFVSFSSHQCSLEQAALYRLILIL